MILYAPMSYVRNNFRKTLCEYDECILVYPSAVVFIVDIDVFLVFLSFSAFCFCFFGSFFFRGFSLFSFDSIVHSCELHLSHNPIEQKIHTKVYRFYWIPLEERLVCSLPFVGRNFVDIFHLKIHFCLEYRHLVITNNSIKLHFTYMDWWQCKWHNDECSTKICRYYGWSKCTK